MTVSCKQNLVMAVALAALLTFGGNGLSEAVSEQSDQSIVLENDLVRFIISRNNGAITASWDKVTGRKLMAECADVYRKDKPADKMQSTEIADRVDNVQVKGVGGRPTVIISCHNVDLSDLRISKRYMLSGKVLSKRVAFSTCDSEGFFIHYGASTKLDSQFMTQCNRGGALKEDRVVTETEDSVLRLGPYYDPPLAIAKDYEVGLATYRYRVNDRFVSPIPATVNYTAFPRAKWTCNGWISRGFVDYVKAGEAVSGEVHWVVFRGDFTAFYRYYEQLPPYEELYSFEHPEWTKRVVCDQMYLQIGEVPFCRAAEPLVVPTTIWYLNLPWGNYWADSGHPKSNVYDIASGHRAQAPNAKVSAYSIMLFDKGSDVYLHHPEFGIRDIDGELIPSGTVSDSTGGATFHYQIKNPACREYLLNMHTNRHEGWQLDFHYMDGGGFGAEIPDWHIRDVAQWYDWMDYLKELRRRLQEVDPDAAIWTNGTGAPYTDFGYCEWREAQWRQLGGPQWRSEVLEWWTQPKFRPAMYLFRIKLTEPPGYTVVPTYGHPAADPSIAAYTLMYGWCGNLGFIFRLPWMKAAWELRGMEIVEDAVTPRWWRKDVNFEAYGFRKGEIGIVNVLSHVTKPASVEAGRWGFRVIGEETAPRKVELTVDTAKLGLEPGKPLYGWVLKMNDPRPVEDVNPRNPGPGLQVYAAIGEGSQGTWLPIRPDQSLTEEQMKKGLRVYHARAMTPDDILFAGVACPAKLHLEVPTQVNLVSTVILTHTPAVLESVDGCSLEIGLTEHQNVTVTGGRSGQVISLMIDCRADSATVLVPGLTAATTQVQAGGAVQVEEASWAGRPALRLAISKGRHQIQLTPGGN